MFLACVFLVENWPILTPPPSPCRGKFHVFLKPSLTHRYQQLKVGAQKKTDFEQAQAFDGNIWRAEHFKSIFNML